MGVCEEELDNDQQPLQRRVHAGKDCRRKLQRVAMGAVVLPWATVGIFHTQTITPPCCRLPRRTL